MPSYIADSVSLRNDLGSVPCCGADAESAGASIARDGRRRFMREPIFTDAELKVVSIEGADENPYIELLAKKLFEDMSELNASSDEEWDEASHWTKEFYRTYIERLLIKWEWLTGAHALSGAHSVDQGSD